MCAKVKKSWKKKTNAKNQNICLRIRPIIAISNASTAGQKNESQDFIKWIANIRWNQNTPSQPTTTLHDNNYKSTNFKTFHIKIISKHYTHHLQAPVFLAPVRVHIIAQWIQQLWKISVGPIQGWEVHFVRPACVRTGEGTCNGWSIKSFHVHVFVFIVRFCNTCMRMCKQQDLQCFCILCSACSCCT